MGCIVWVSGFESGMRCVISYSLKGTKQLYWLGLLNNIRVMPYILPGWKPRVYIEQGHFLCDMLKDLGVEYIEVEDKYGGTYCSMWRFYAFAEPDIDYVLVRDADSVLSYKDTYCVDEWLLSGKKLHSIREFPTAMPLCAGTMGLKGGLFPDIVSLTDAYVEQHGTQYSVDECFLRDVVYARYREEMCLHGANGRPVRAESIYPFTGFKVQWKWSDVFDWKKFRKDQV